MAKEQSTKNKDNQKNHNSATRGVNTKKKKVVFDFDELELDWVEEMAYFVALNEYKVYKESMPDGTFEYSIRAGDDLVLSVISTRNLNRSAFSLNRKRRRRRRR